ncbi:uncharacterized protein G2W53_004607 [Senna tora]|uniref:Uncharacterized protein n=1 Tax=Senna tora TaxID=362788 RepID=A0A835CHD9_9FABA|nr:uncharacterized protein G2W53_004607 [Senna tora]
MGAGLMSYLKSKKPSLETIQRTAPRGSSFSLRFKRSQEIGRYLEANINQGRQTKKSFKT